MKVAMIFLLGVSAWLNTLTSVEAADNCSKDCRDFQRACLKAHSQSACTTDYAICMKHCKQK